MIETTDAMGVRVIVPIGPDGEFTGQVDLYAEDTNGLNAQLEELGMHVEDIAFIALFGGIRPEDIGFPGLEIPSTTHHQCSDREWCDHWADERRARYARR